MVSVIVPIFNTERYLEKCLTSIMQQTYQDLEIILVNDGSIDRSGKIAASFAEQDSRFFLIEQENQGVSTARNNGLDHAHGEYILFVDSDDWLEPIMVEELVHNMKQSDTDISCCQYDIGVKYPGEQLEIWSKDKAIREFLVHRYFNGALVNKLFKRELIGEKRLDLDIKYGEDALFLWKNLLYVNSICITNQVLYHVSLHGDSASGGGFKPIRLQSHQVWKHISSSAKQINKECYLLSMAQLGKMAFDSFYMMLLSNTLISNYEQECRNIISECIWYDLCADYIQFKIKVIMCAYIWMPSITKKILYGRISRMRSKQNER